MNPFRFIRRIIWLTVAVGLTLAIARVWAQDAGSTIGVRILPQAEVFGEAYTLGEIAEFDGTDLAAIRAISGPYLEARLRRDGQVPMERIRLIVPHGASVVRAAQLIPGKDIAAAVLAHARQEMAAGGGDYSQELLSTVQDVLLPKGDLAWDVEAVGENLRPGGPRNYRVSANVNGEEAWRSIVRVRQSVYQDVVVTTRPLRRGAALSDENVSVVRRDVQTLNGGPYLHDLQTAIGQRTRRPLGRGELLRADVVSTPAAVQEGGRVTLEYRASGVWLRAVGVAMVDGNVGQFIPVRNVGTGKTVYGVVAPGDVVRVN
jgi:flagella basal body P-ring formation protein FlgA